MLTLLLALSGTPARADDSDPFAVDATVVTLDNGLRVVVERQDRTDTLAVHLHVGVGSRDEIDGQRGLAHLFEHLMFEGSAHARGNAYDELVTQAGGDNNAATNQDETTYYATVPSGALERMLFLESDRLGFLGAGITDEAVSNQIDVVLQEREQSYAAVHGQDLTVLELLLFPEDHPYHRQAIGTVQDVQGFTVDGARAFHRTWYVPGNAVLGLVGNIDPEHAIERARHWFSDVPAAPSPERAAPGSLPHHATTQRGALPGNVDDFTVYLGWYGAPLGDEHEAALVVASFLLSDGRGTRLDRHYYRKDWVTDSDAQHWASELDGEFIVALSSDKPRLARLERMAVREVQRLIDRPPTADELGRAKARIRSLLLRQLERPSDRAEALVDCVRLTGGTDCARQDWERVQAVTADDVVAALSELGEAPIASLWVVPSHRLDTIVGRPHLGAP